MDKHCIINDSVLTESAQDVDGDRCRAEEVQAEED
jgi:hypothetical protein